MAKDVRRLTERDHTMVTNAVRHRLIETHLKAIEDPEDALAVALEIHTALERHIEQLREAVQDKRDAELAATAAPASDEPLP